jgi:hypothetical protein
MRRSLFTLTTAVSVMMFIAVCVLWVWSAPSPRVIARHDFATRAVRLGASGGTLSLRSDVTDSSRFVYPKVGPSGEFAGFSYGTSTLGSWLNVPLWFVLLAVAMTFLASLRLRRPRSKSPGLCPVCSYDLRATPERCPECGTAVASR